MLPGRIGLLPGQVPVLSRGCWPKALTLHSPVAHPRSPWLTLVARWECLKRHGVGERESELSFTHCLAKAVCRLRGSDLLGAFSLS